MKRHTGKVIGRGSENTYRKVIGMISEEKYGEGDRKG